jgi:hypothetical protein
MSYATSRKGGYGKSPERKSNGRNTRRQDDKAMSAEEAMEFYADPENQRPVGRAVRRRVTR